jgi:hypothetical protein
MQVPPDDKAEASIPMETVGNVRTLNGTMSRKVAIRTCPFMPVAGADLVSSQPPSQYEDAPAAKRARLETPASVTGSTSGDARTLAVEDSVETASKPAAASNQTLSWLSSLPFTLTSWWSSSQKAPPESEDAPGASTTGLQISPSSASTVVAAVAGAFVDGDVFEDTRMTEDTVSTVPLNDTVAVSDVVAVAPTTAHAMIVAASSSRNDGNSRTLLRKWTPVEDTKLAVAVEKCGLSDWAAVAKMVPSRTHTQCRKRWFHSLDPTAGGGAIARQNNKWSLEEAATLTAAVEKYGIHGKWSAISKLVPGRTNDQCRQKWYGCLAPTVAGGTIARHLGKWTPEEDAKLTEAVKKAANQDPKNWMEIATQVPGRTNEQCYRRWVRYLGPSDRAAGRWKPEEDTKLAEAVEEHGNDWVRIAKLVPGRTNKQCRERWLDSLVPRLRHKAFGGGRA